MRNILTAALLFITQSAAAAGAGCFDTLGPLTLEKIRSDATGPQFLGCVNRTFDILSGSATVSGGTVALSTFTWGSGSTISTGTNTGGLDFSSAAVLQQGTDWSIDKGTADFSGSVDVGQLTENGSDTLSNDISGNAGTATAWQVDPDDCPAGTAMQGQSSTGTPVACIAIPSTGDFILKSGDTAPSSSSHTFQGAMKIEGELTVGPSAAVSTFTTSGDAFIHRDTFVGNDLDVTNDITANNRVDVSSVATFAKQVKVGAAGVPEGTIEVEGGRAVFDGSRIYVCVNGCPGGFVPDSNLYIKATSGDGIIDIDRANLGRTAGYRWRTGGTDEWQFGTNWSAGQFQQSMALLLKTGAAGTIVEHSTHGYTSIGGAFPQYTLDVRGVAVSTGAIITGDGLSINTVDYKWPAADGGVGEFLKTDGAGNVDWDTPAGGGDTLAAADEEITGTWTFTAGVNIATGASVAHGNATTGELFGASGGSVWNAVSIDGATQSSGCVVHVKVPDGGSTTDPLQFTSTTTEITTDGVMGVLLTPDCAPGSICKIGVHSGIYRVQADASGIGAQFLDLSATRCRVRGVTGNQEGRKLQAGAVAADAFFYMILKSP